MKKTVISGVTVIILSWITNTTCAQFVHSVARSDSAASFAYNEPSAPGVVKDLKGVNPKATFKDGVQTKIFFNKRGGQTGMIRYYTENKLPNEVQRLVKAIYYDADIFLVTEVTVGNRTAYLVKVKDEMCTKTIRVMNGEMDVIEEFKNL